MAVTSGSCCPASGLRSTMHISSATSRSDPIPSHPPSESASPSHPFCSARRSVGGSTDARATVKPPKSLSRLQVWPVLSTVR